MLKLQTFTFNPFLENTYILYNENKQAIIIDPGMYNAQEFTAFFDFIEKHELSPELILGTHTHLDHVFGNAAVVRRFKIPYAFHEKDKPVFDAANASAAMYGLEFERSPAPDYYLNDQQEIALGDDRLKVFLTPGHSPGSVCFYCEQQHFVISGDVLFHLSIGRSDFPGGNHDTLLYSIHHTLMPLPDETLVYSGHGPVTHIGFERMNNPFLTRI